MAEQGLRLLSIDWDYFFPDSIGVPPFCLPVFQGGQPDLEATLFKTWVCRADIYVEHGKQIPETSGDEADFWSRFAFSPKSSLFTADSHHFAAEPEVIDGVSEIWNFDAHHDAGYEDMPNAQYGDGNWLMAYSRTVEKHIRYPSWKQWAFDEEPHPLIEVDRQFDDVNNSYGTFDRVFICRSGKWVAPWIDDAYRDFVSSCPVQLTRSWPLIAREGIVAALKAEIEKRQRRGCPD